MQRSSLGRVLHICQHTYQDHACGADVHGPHFTWPKQATTPQLETPAIGGRLEKIKTYCRKVSEDQRSVPTLLSSAFKCSSQFTKTFPNPPNPYPKKDKFCLPWSADLNKRCWPPAGRTSPWWSLAAGSARGNPGPSAAPVLCSAAQLPVGLSFWFDEERNGSEGLYFGIDLEANPRKAKISEKPIQRMKILGFRSVTMWPAVAESLWWMKCTQVAKLLMESLTKSWKAGSSASSAPVKAFNKKSCLDQELCKALSLLKGIFYYFLVFVCFKFCLYAFHINQLGQESFDLPENGAKLVTPRNTGGKVPSKASRGSIVWASPLLGLELSERVLSQECSE